jgi:sulfoxide reductase heme-binding subunit YedZ
MPRLFEGAMRNWKFVIGFLSLSIAAWVSEFAYQFYIFSQGDIWLSIIRASSLTGATFISLSLLSSSIFRWVPGWAKYWYIRRSLGVVGVCFALVHVFFVLDKILAWNLNLVFGVLDPFQNPLLLGAMSLPILVAMMLTSTDWAVSKMGFLRWKALHRLVYFAYIFMVFHFLVTYPAALMSPPGYFLILVTIAALAGELYWFLKITWPVRFYSIGSAIGFLVIFLWLLFIYMFYLRQVLG